MKAAAPYLAAQFHRNPHLILAADLSVVRADSRPVKSRRRRRS
jgi:hypothetical protein